MIQNSTTEKTLCSLRDEIKSLKSSMPIAGSLLDLYFYSETTTVTYQENTHVYCEVKFVPDDPSEGLGITEVFYMLECFATGGYWSQFNPIFLTVHEGYYENSEGEAQVDEEASFAGFGDFETKVTVCVYSTVPGHIEIELT